MADRPQPLTPTERNAIAAKMLKAEMLGNTTLLSKLRMQLAQDDQLLRRAAEAKPPHIQAKIEEAPVRNDQQKRTRTSARPAERPGTSKSFVDTSRPSSSSSSAANNNESSEQSESKSNPITLPEFPGRRYGLMTKEQLIEDEARANGLDPKEVVTKLVTLERKRDVNHLSLREMFARERNTTATEESKLFISSSSKIRSFGVNLDEEYERGALDGNPKKKKRGGGEEFTQRVSFVKSGAGQDLSEHDLERERSTNSCERCVDRLERRLTLTKGDEHAYLVMSELEPIICGKYGEFYISNRSHGTAASLVSAERDTQREVDRLRRALCEMFSPLGYDVLFWEMYLKGRARSGSAAGSHFRINCVPVKKKYTEQARMYFRKSILESEEEWSINRQLVKFEGRDASRCLPAGLSYFWIAFGPRNETAFGHVVEDESRFQANFPFQVLAGLLDIDPNKWRRPRVARHEDLADRIGRVKPEWVEVDPFR